MYRFRYFEESMTASRTVNDYRLSLRILFYQKETFRYGSKSYGEAMEVKAQFAKVNLIFSPNEFQSKVLSHVNESK